MIALFRRLATVALLAALVWVPSFSADPPCDPIPSLSATADPTGDLLVVRETPFRMNGILSQASVRTQAEVTDRIRRDPDYETMDLVLKSSDGRLCRVRLNEQAVEPGDLRAVPLRPEGDSLFLTAHPLIARSDYETFEWRLLYTPSTGRWTGQLLSASTLDVGLPTVEKSIGWDDPETAAERAFLSAYEPIREPAEK